MACYRIYANGRTYIRNEKQLKGREEAQGKREVSAATQYLALRAGRKDVGGAWVGRRGWGYRISEQVGANFFTATYIHPFLRPLSRNSSNMVRKMGVTTSKSDRPSHLWEIERARPL